MVATPTDTDRLSRQAFDFIDEDYLHGLLDSAVDATEVREILAKSLSKTALAVEETAKLVNANEPDL